MSHIACILLASAASLVGCSAAPGGSTTGSLGAPSSSAPAGEDAGATSITTPGSQAPGGEDAGTSDDASSGSSPSPDASSPAEAYAPAPTVRVVAYLPNYSGSYSDWAKSIDFTTMTDLNLAFATADSSNAWDMGASDSDVAAIVTAAHAAGVKVFASLGGGGGDQTVIAQYKTSSNLAPLIANLDTFVSTHDFDGVDIDIEDASNLGTGYTGFVDAVVAKLRPEGKLVTAAVAQYLQGSMADATLHEFDFLNVMIYSTYSDSVSAMDYYSGTKSVPKSLLTLGAGFFGTDSAGNEYAYSAIMAADSTAWSKDQATVSGQTVSYTGVASMQKLVAYSKGFGGIMFWDLTQDTTDSHSLYKTIQGAM